MDDVQIAALSKHLKEMNGLLEKILHTQFGINDKMWLDAIQTIELGFSDAVNFIAEVKGKARLGPGIFTDEDVKRILDD